jgi:cation transport ATPase
MRCREVKLWLNAEQNMDDQESRPDDAQFDLATLSEHLKHCKACRVYQQHQSRLNMLFSTEIRTTSVTKMRTPSRNSRPNISTERIMQAVERQRRITQQLEDLRTQQRRRVARLHRVGALVAVSFFLLGFLLASLAAGAMMQPELLANTLALLSNVIAVFIVGAQYLQSLLTVITGNSWLLSSIALMVVVMMGIWLRLMRYPQQA